MLDASIGQFEGHPSTINDGKIGGFDLWLILFGGSNCVQDCRSTKNVMECT